MQHLQTLCQLSGVSGREHAVREYILEQLNSYPTEKTVTVDALGNVLVHLKGEQAASQTLLFAAHMDEVGLIITHIEDNGTLKFAPVGGIDEKALFGTRVWVGDVVGVIGGKAIHQCGGDEKKTVPSVSKMCIDIGAKDKAEAEQRVRIGDVATFGTDWITLGDHKVKAKALDDRAGCALLLQLAQTTPKFDIVLAFTVQEEVGLRGAKTAAFAVEPDVAVVVDVTTAADIAGVSGADCVCHQGDGPVVSFMDGRTLYDADLYDTLMNTAKALGIPAQTKTRVAGGNDAGSIQTTGRGARVAAVSLPGRYIHSSGCVIDTRDYENTAQLLCAAVAAILGDTP